MTKFAHSSVATATLSLLAHLPCCGGGLLLSLGGATGALGFLYFLEPYRYWLVGLSLLQVLIGLWIAYRKPACTDECCAENPPANKKRQIGFAWGVAIVVLCLSTFTVFMQDDSSHDHRDTQQTARN